MVRRQKLHEKLIEVLGSNYVYYNPPESTKIKYPCIVYSPSSKNFINADNIKYRSLTQYQLTIIDRNPDSEIADRVLFNFQYCTTERWFVYDELNHWVLRLFY